MTAKEYLRQAYWLNAQINDDLAEAAQLRALAISVPSRQIKISKRGDKSHASSRTAAVIQKITLLENRINAEIDEFIDLQSEIRTKITAMPPGAHQTVLQKRYLNFKRWEQIAVEMNYTYRNIMYLHGEALRKFEQLFSC
jgi:hypothetical protein